ncbi:MAG: glycosyltransferase family 4 protein [Acidobacteriaceae bacterium]
MNYLLTFFTAMLLSVAIIPLMIQLAPRLGMVDLPDPRKVHSSPIPRVGGIGIVIGTLVAILVWAPMDSRIYTYIFGSVILLAFGMWDDSRELGHYVKFIGQFIAVTIVVYYGKTFVHVLPFFGLTPIPAAFGKPFTVFAMVGMINAANHADGLDGLAGGLSVLSLIGIAYLALIVHGSLIVTMVVAALGGVLGFLRYNTHPARVFMGDGGSQFLGFTLGFLVVVLTQSVNTAISPALPALLLGLPIIDILAVFAQRVYHRMNWFRASKNHIHHRLLELGFDHYEAVVIIYSIQTLFVLSAILLRYQSDWLIISLYLGVCTLLFVLLTFAEHREWRTRKHRTRLNLGEIIHIIDKYGLFADRPAKLVTVAIPVLFLLVSMGATQIPHDLGVGASVLAILLVIHLVLFSKAASIVLRAINYVTAAFVIYIDDHYVIRQIHHLATAEIAYFIILAAAIGIAVRYAKDLDFKTTPMDYLVVFIVLSVGILTHDSTRQAELGAMAMELVVVFYGCELIASRMTSRWNLLNVSSLVTLLILGARGLGLG